MTPGSPGPTCLIRLGQEDSWRKWKAPLKNYIAEAGLQPADYSEAAVADSEYFLALPNGDDSVVYEVGYAMGSGLKVLVVVDENDDFKQFHPAPTKIVHVDLHGPDSGKEAKESITDALSELFVPSSTDVPTRKPNIPYGDQCKPGLGSYALVVTSVEQAEQLFQEFLADGLSQELIRRLLTEAGCRQSWLNFRIQRQFGGW